MEGQGMYKEILLQHYRHPHNKCDGELQGADVVRRGANPRCGDEIEVGLYLQDGRVREVKFRGRGCSVCIASSSLMTDAATGHDKAAVRQLCDRMRDWFQQGDGDNLSAPPHDLQALSAVRQYPARRRCVLLPWEALADALDALDVL